MAQIGTLRVQASGTTVSVPIFDTGDSGSSVFEMVKIQTGTNIGFIPVVENSTDAAYPYLKVQTQNHGIVHVHNESSLISIEWKTAADWDSAITETGTMHDALTNTDLSDSTVVTQSPPIGSTDNITSGLVGWWPLHTSANRAVDLSGSGNSSVKTLGSPTNSIVGRSGLQATGFDGDDGYETPITNSDINGYGSGTVTFWIRPDSLTFSGQPENGNDLSDPILPARKTEFLIGFDGGSNLTFNLYDGSHHTVDSAKTNWSTDKWYHIAVTFGSSDGQQIYIDGSLDASNSFTGVCRAKSNELTIGRYNSSYSTSNGIDATLFDVRFYSDVKSASTIQQIRDYATGSELTDPRLHDGSDSGAVARYKLDGDATDSWGSNDGTNNGVSFVDDSIRGKAGDFQPTNADNINIGNIITAPTDLSITAWVKPQDLSTSFQGIVDDWDGSNREYHFSNNSGKLTFYIGDSGSGTSFSSANILRKDAWQFVSATLSSNDTLRLYRNGIVEETFSPSVTASSTSNDYAIGRDGYDSSPNVFDGLIDDVRIYKRVLEPYEMFQTYLWGTRGRDMRQMVAQA